MRIEFTSPQSGAYIHETAEIVTIDFPETNPELQYKEEIKINLKDKDGGKYVLWIHSEPSSTLGGSNINIDLEYPDGGSMGLESIWNT